jgi:Polyketide cyclase / dehydrase and lipid transport
VGFSVLSSRPGAGSLAAARITGHDPVAAVLAIPCCVIGYTARRHRRGGRHVMGRATRPRTPVAMVKVYASSVVDAPADRVWALVRDFNGLPQWHPLIAESRIESGLPSDRVGCIRNFQTRDGGAIREQLLALSDYDYSCTYSIVQSSMAVENYVATLKLTPITDGNRTFTEWSAEFDCELARAQDLVKQIADGVFQAGFDALKRHFRRG